MPTRQGIWGIAHSTGSSTNGSVQSDVIIVIQPSGVDGHVHMNTEKKHRDQYLTPSIQSGWWYVSNPLKNDGVRQVAKLFSTEWKVIKFHGSKAPGHVQKHRNPERNHGYYRSNSVNIIHEWIAGWPGFLGQMRHGNGWDTPSYGNLTLWLCQHSYWKWQFIVDFPIEHGDFP